MEKSDGSSGVESPSHTRQCRKEGTMAAQLKDDGRYPSAQKLQAGEYRHFVETCKNPPKPSAKFKALMKGPTTRQG